MAERQTAARLADIRADHADRYRFAAGRVSGRVLDIACGCGYGAALLAVEASEVVAVDRSKGAIKYARQHWARPNVDYRLGKIGEFTDPGGFDWAVCFETVEHLEDDTGALRWLHEIAPDLIVSVPNEDALPFDPKRFPFHVRHYSAAELEALLAGTGWRISERWAQAGKFCHVTKGWERMSRTLIAVAHRA